MKKIVVFGGNGFVGSQVCRAALSLGLEVTSINRSGRPSMKAEWVDRVNWVSGDISNESIDESSSVMSALNGAVGAVSCVGAFGSNEAMLKINGTSNVNAMGLAHRAGIIIMSTVDKCTLLMRNSKGVERFTYVSTGRSTMPSFVLPGYFEGKILSENAIVSTFGSKGTILRPGFIYGVRNTPIGDLPLQFIGGPLRYVLQLTGLHKMRDFPLLSMPLTLPVSVEAVGYTAASAAAGILDEIGNVRAMMQQEACKYNGISALFESGDIDLVGKLVEAEYISGRVQR